MTKELNISKRFTLSSLMLALAVVLGFGIFTTQGANAQLVCRVQQITDEPVDDSDQTTISGDGNLIAFRSEANFTGQNIDNNDEIFIYNVRKNEFTQATFSTGGSNGNPDISSDGKFIAFDSRADINGVPNNGSRQVFLHDVMTGTNTQITNGDKNSDAPVINGLNNQIAFVSQADLTGDNLLNLTQIFLFNITNGTFQQITNSVFGITVFPSSNFEGNRVAFESSANLTGQNPAPGAIREIFLYNRDTDSLTQITHNTAGSASVTDSSIDESGNLIALASSANPNGGGMSFPGGSQLYLFDGTSPIELVTEGQEPGLGVAAISGDGSCIAFTSNVDITGQNPQEGDQIFHVNLDTRIFTQLTNFQPGDGNPPRDPRPNGDCTRISYHRQVATGGPNVGQIFLATCLDPATARNIPTLSEWGLIAMAAVLGIVGLLVVRRRVQAA